MMGAAATTALGAEFPDYSSAQLWLEREGFKCSSTFGHDPRTATAFYRREGQRVELKPLDCKPEDVSKRWGRFLITEI